jgi:hypothetical protein
MIIDMPTEPDEHAHPDISLADRYWSCVGREPSGW